MIEIKCKDTLYTYNLYHITKAFFPNEEIKQCVDTEQEPLVQLNLDQDSCFYVTEEDVVSSDELSGEQKRQEKKRLVTQKVYRYLSEVTERSLSWGMLTGVRPTKLVMQKIEAGMSKREALNYLQENDYVSYEKAKLAYEIAEREKKILAELDCRNGFSLYVGIPFCPSICSYCSFGSASIKAWKDRTDLYVEAVCHELKAVAGMTAGKKLDTVYIGGGTPTSLSAEQLERILFCIDELFLSDMLHGGREHLLEYTVEAGRPDSITEEKLQVIRKHPVTRISVNPQTMQQKTLDLVGRKHTVREVREVFTLARKNGFDNINMDLIAGLPGETASDMKDTLRQIEELQPDSLTVHSLAIKRAAKMGQEKRKQDMQSDIAEMVDMAAAAAKRLGLVPYYLYRQKNIAGNFENVGYAKVDKAGIYNILIMEERQTILAVGAGSTTKIVLPEKIRLDNGKETNLIRVENVKNIAEYIDRIEEMIERKEEVLWH